MTRCYSMLLYCVLLYRRHGGHPLALDGLPCMNRAGRRGWAGGVRGSPAARGVYCAPAGLPLRLDARQRATIEAHLAKFAERLEKHCREKLLAARVGAPAEAVTKIRPPLRVRYGTARHESFARQ